MALLSTGKQQQQQQQQHVVAVPALGQGHLNPLMRFCKLLASQGFLITFVNMHPVHHKSEERIHRQEEDQEAGSDELRQSFCASESAPHDNFRRADIPLSGLCLFSDYRISLQPLFEAVHGIAPQLELLILQLNRQGPPVTCIISDCSNTIPTQMVADKLSIPRIALFAASASVLLLHYYVGELISTANVLEALARKAEGREVVCEGFAGLPTIYNDELPCFKHVVDDDPFVWEYITKAFQEAFRRAHAVVINSFEDLEAPALEALSKHVSLPVYGVGPFVEPIAEQSSSSTSLWKEDTACLHWLDQQPPLSVLYMSFGSITLLSQPQLEEIVAGLLASQQRFLCVFRPDLVQNARLSADFISEIVSRSHGKGCVVDWAPQLQVLSHPSVGGFFTHCGWNSIMEALACGVPMLCWPYFADQMFNARYVVQEWKVGLRCEARKVAEAGACFLVHRHEVETVIKALLQGKEGEALRKKALWLREAGSRSLRPGGTSHSNVQALLRSFIQDPSPSTTM